MTYSNAPKHWKLLAAGCALALAILAPAVHGQQFALHDGDTVVFYGDSITAQRLYTRFVEDFVLTRYPALNIRFVNAGVPGDTVSGGYAGKMQERVERDVAPFHPTAITVMLGMNDGGWGYEPAKAEAAFQQGYPAVIAALRKAAPGAAITLIRPTPYDEITHGTEFPGYSRAIDKLADDVAQISTQLQSAGDKNISLTDFHGPMVEALERAKNQFPQLAPLMVPDRIHPSATGHWIMAAALMSAWHVDPVVSRLELDAGSAEVIAKDRTAVTNIGKSPDGLEWTEVDDALPLPLDFNNAMTAVLLGVSDIAQLDQEVLRIEALEPGRYELSIDGKPVGIFSHEELQHGVNIALMKTPMIDQARDIDGSEEQRAELDQARFILSADVKDSPTSAVAETRLRQAGDELATTVREDLKLKPHRFELRRK